MAYDEQLAQRVRDLLESHPEVTERKMFGGLCFFLSGNMLCGIEIGRYMFRVGPEQENEALQRFGASPLAKPMKGLIHVSEEACRGSSLYDWLALARNFVASLPAKEKPSK